MLHVPDLPEADAVKVLRYFLSRAAALAHNSAKGLPAAIPSEVRIEQSGDRPPAKRVRGEGGGSTVSTRASRQDGAGAKVKGEATGVVSVCGSSGRGVDNDDGAPASLRKKMKKGKKNCGVLLGDSAAASRKEEEEEEEDVTAKGGNDHNPYKGANGIAHSSNRRLNGHAAAAGGGGGDAPHDEGGTSSEETGGCSEDKQAEACRTSGAGDTGAVKGGVVKKKNKRLRVGGDRSAETATVRAERGLRVALALPYNEAFLRSALSGMRHGEVVVVVKVRVDWV